MHALTEDQDNHMFIKPGACRLLRDPPPLLGNNTMLLNEYTFLTHEVYKRDNKLFS